MVVVEEDLFKDAAVNQERKEAKEEGRRREEWTSWGEEDRRRGEDEEGRRGEEEEEGELRREQCGYRSGAQRVRCMTQTDLFLFAMLEREREKTRKLQAAVAQQFLSKHPNPPSKGGNAPFYR